jgi:hypothetical protein
MIGGDATSHLFTAEAFTKKLAKPTQEWQADGEAERRHRGIVMSERVAQLLAKSQRNEIRRNSGNIEDIGFARHIPCPKVSRSVSSYTGRHCSSGQSNIKLTYSTITQYYHSHKQRNSLFSQ